MSAGTWIRKPQPPLERGSWLPRTATETPLETLRRIVRERAEQAAAQAFWDEQWRRDMRDRENERRYAKRSKRQAAKEPVTRSFEKSAYTRTTDTITRDDDRRRFQHDDDLARIVGHALDRWMRRHGIRHDESRWHRAQPCDNYQRNTAAQI
jgi:hypothetical protein